MTAAAARPPLFSHLVASRPEADRGSVGATVFSIVLHGAIIMAALAAGARVGTKVTTPDPIPIVLPELTMIEQAGASATQPSGARPSTAPVAPPLPAPPDPVTSTIPTPAQTVPFQITDFVGPTRVKEVATGPGTGPGSGVSDQPGAYVPVTVLPRLLNRAEVQRTMQRLYPAILLQAGIGGTAVVWLRLDEEGRVIDTQLKRTSGHAALDRAAEDVALRARFSPAYNRDLRVRVWVELPVVFTAQN
jgi:protein TonB